MSGILDTNGILSIWCTAKRKLPVTGAEENWRRWKEQKILEFPVFTLLSDKTRFLTTEKLINCREEEDKSPLMVPY